MKNEYEVTEDIFIMWSLENMFKGVRLKFFIFWIVAAVLAIICCLIYDLDAFFIFLVVFCLYRAFLRSFVVTKSRYKTLKKSQGNDKWIRTVIFEDDFIRVNDGNFSAKYAYSDIVKIQDNGNRICLDTNKQDFIRLYKDSFIGCSCDQCINMIKAKNPGLYN